MIMAHYIGGNQLVRSRGDAPVKAVSLLAKLHGNWQSGFEHAVFPRRLRRCSFHSKVGQSVNAKQQPLARWSNVQVI
jgi:hypothetical protein